MGIRNDLLGGNNFIDGEVLEEFDLNDTFDATIKGSVSGQAQVPYTTLKSTGTWVNEGYLASDRFTTASGVNSTVNTGGSSATFSTDKYISDTISGANVTENAESNMPSAITVSQKDGYVVSVKKDCLLVSVTKHPSSGATRALLYNSGTTLIETASFSGNVATFSTPQELFSGLSYKIVADNNGSNYSRRFLNPGNFPYVGTNLDFISGISGSTPTTTSSNALNITSVITQSLNFVNGTVITDQNTLALDGTEKVVSVYSDSLIPTNTSIKAKIQESSVTEYDGVNFSVNTEETSPETVFFKSDGTKMYVVGTSADTVFQYSLGTAWNVGTASYDNVSFSIGTQDGSPVSLFFKDDGSKMYLLGFANRTVFQYSLSTAWDLSSASYDGVSFSVNTEETQPRGLFFKSDGTKMYLLGFTNDTVFQYSLSTAWNVGTASYDSVSFSVSGQDGSPISLFFKSDGTKMYVVGILNNTVFQYSLGTAWNVGTTSYDNVSFSVNTEETSPRSLFFKGDGTKMYVVGATNDTVFQYSLANWSLSNFYTDLSTDIVLNENKTSTIPLTATPTNGKPLTILFTLETTDPVVTPELYGYGVYKQ